MKFLKKILYLILIFFVVVVVCYLINSFTKFSDKGIDSAYYLDKYYLNEDRTVFVYFGDFEKTSFIVIDGDRSYAKIDYEKGIFILKAESAEYYFGQVTSDILYSSNFNDYFYNQDFF